jgi:excisionase family DNA binding protein
MAEPLAEGWISISEAETATGYARAYLRRLATQGRVRACKIGRDWLINHESLLAYKERMDTLGTDRHNPWRTDLTVRGRGRQKVACDE